MGIARIYYEAEEQKTIIDPLAIVCIMGALLIFGVQMFSFLPNIEEIGVAQIIGRGLIGFVLLLSGMTTMLFFGVHVPKPETKGGNIDMNLSNFEWSLILSWMAIDLMAIVLINAVTFQYSHLWQMSFIDYPQAVFQWVMFSTAIGWTEEIVFRGMMIPALTRATGKIVAVLTSTLAWVGFHFGVYLLSSDALVIIFFSGIVLAISFIGTRNRLSTTMLPHGLNNFIAVGTQGATLRVPIGLVIPLLKVLVK
ncbi:MAG: CPBP family intramembrane glutamic endopeptidase [archaeon]